MKTQKICLANMREKLGRDEMKVIKGGWGADPGGGGGCVQCSTSSGMSSCWYSTKGEEVCGRVYPNEPIVAAANVPCTLNCHMN